MEKRSRIQVGFVIALVAVGALEGCRQHSQIPPLGDAEQGFLLRDRLEGGQSVTHAISIVTTITEGAGYGQTSTTSADLVTRALAVRRDKRIHEAKLENMSSSERDMLAEIVGSAALDDLMAQMNETAFEMDHRCQVQEVKGGFGGAMLLDRYGPFGLGINTIVFPEERVKYGDSWQGTVKIGGPVPQLGKVRGVDVNELFELYDEEVVLTYTLVGEESKNGRNCLVITATTDSRTVHFIEPMKIWLDPQTGQIEELTVVQLVHSDRNNGRAAVTITRKG